MSERRVVVTGMGLITCCGTGVEKSWQALIHGQSGIGPVTRFDTAKHETKFGGQVNDFNVEEWVDKKEARRMDRFEQFALGAAEMAMRDSGLHVTPENAEHLKEMQLVDMEIFREAVIELGDLAKPLADRAVVGAEALPRLAEQIR